MVLAKGTMQGTTGKEDHPRSVVTRYWGLLPTVQARPGNPHFRRLATNADLSQKAVDTTVVWAEKTGFVRLETVVCMHGYILTNQRPFR